LVALILICAWFAMATPIFLRPSNLINVTRQVSILGTAAVGMAILMVSGGIDLSIGSNLALSGIITATMMLDYDLPVSLAILIGLLSALLVGVINAFIVIKVKVPALITTLAMMTILRGAGYIITGGVPLYSFPASFKQIGAGYIGPIPIPVVIMIVFLVLGYLFLGKTYFGRYFYALGGNEEATRLSGVNIDRMRYLAYSICGLLTGVAAMILMGRINSAQPTAGTGFELDVITAVVLGGVSIAGGEGRIQNVFLGVLIIGVISNGLILLNIHDYYQMVIKGMTLMLAVSIDRFGKVA
jgi:ribose transport system permease protein